jgi:hypothetical protein
MENLADKACVANSRILRCRQRWWEWSEGWCVGSSTTRALTVRVASRVRVEDAFLWIAYRSGNAVETKSRERESVESTDAGCFAIASSSYNNSISSSIVAKVLLSPKKHVFVLFPRFVRNRVVSGNIADLVGWGYSGRILLFSSLFEGVPPFSAEPEKVGVPPTRGVPTFSPLPTPP